MKIKKVALLIASVLVSILILEVGLRLFTNFPLHGHLVKRIKGDILGYRTDPNLDGVDANGFRNPSVIKQADIVAIGDSFTYGYNVEPKESWPYQLADMADMSVYNMGVGGYGMVHYYYLIDEALKLKPKYIILGFYPANDLDDIEKMENHLPLELIAIRGKYNQVHQSDKEKMEDRGLVYKVKSLIRFDTAIGSIMAYLKDFIIPFSFCTAQDVCLTEKNNKTIIKYGSVNLDDSRMDLNNALVVMHIEMSKILFLRMKQKADKNNVKFIILIIPTKELVFYDYLVRKGYKLSYSYHNLARNEREITSIFTNFFDEVGIKYTYVYFGLVNLIEGNGGVYKPTLDGHPLQPGYKVYAWAVWELLKKDK